MCLSQYTDMKTLLSLTCPSWETQTGGGGLLLHAYCGQTVGWRGLHRFVLSDQSHVAFHLERRQLTRYYPSLENCPLPVSAQVQLRHYIKVLTILSSFFLSCRACLFFTTPRYHCQAADAFPITGKALWLISCSGRALNTAFKVIKGSEMWICIMGFIAGAVWWIQWWSKAYYRLSLLLISVPSYATCFFLSSYIVSLQEQ